MIDTRAKRGGLFGIARPWSLLLPAPDKAITKKDRQTFAFIYPLGDWRGLPYSEFDHLKASYPVDGGNR